MGPGIHQIFVFWGCVFCGKMLCFVALTGIYFGYICAFISIKPWLKCNKQPVLVLNTDFNQLITDFIWVGILYIWLLDFKHSFDTETYLRRIWMQHKSCSAHLNVNFTWRTPEKSAFTGPSVNCGGTLLFTLTWGTQNSINIFNQLRRHHSTKWIITNNIFF